MPGYEEVQKTLQNLHNDQHLSWRNIAGLPEYEGLNFATISAIARGRDPKSWKIRQQLSLPLPEAKVIMIAGDVPDGSQALTALKCPNKNGKCGGQYFIPNHPLRRNCFVCSPVRSGARKPRKDWRHLAGEIEPERWDWIVRGNLR